MDMKVENGKLSEYRTRVMLSFNYESGVGPAVTGRDIIGGFQSGEQIVGHTTPYPFHIWCITPRQTFYCIAFPWRATDQIRRDRKLCLGGYPSQT